MDVAGHTFVLQATCASHWLGAIATDTVNLHGIMPGLIADDDLDLMRELMDTHTDIADRWFYAARTALGRAGGRDWWWTHNLARKVLGVWIYVNGMLLRQGVDSKIMQFPDWLDACYTMLWQNGDEEHRMKLDMELSAKPRGIAVHQGAGAIRKMAADFAAD